MKKKLTEELKKAWENRNKAIVFTSVSSEGVPNSIYATCNALFNEDTLLVANNFFNFCWSISICKPFIYQV